MCAIGRGTTGAMPSTSRKAARELNYTPAMSLKSGLASTVDWYLHHVPWWQALHEQGLCRMVA